ncbi:MAG: hypothetical protein QOJ64_61 [Acidobacteriota bacterium]|jgi:hypothetical protein|nr:hypothetical protein [Acidobacteriota bacterium]
MTTKKTFASGVERSCLAINPRLIGVDGPLRGQTFYLDGPVVLIGVSSTMLSFVELRDKCINSLHESRT